MPTNKGFWDQSVILLITLFGWRNFSTPNRRIGTPLSAKMFLMSFSFINGIRENLELNKSKLPNFSAVRKWEIKYANVSLLVGLLWIHKLPSFIWRRWQIRDGFVVWRSMLYGSQRLIHVGITRFVLFDSGNKRLKAIHSNQLSKLNGRKIDSCFDWISNNLPIRCL